jgi:iron complex transport system ATP-binding protein
VTATQSTIRVNRGPNGLLAAGISVRRGSHAVFSELSLQLPARRVWGLLGPNGAGKSTLLEAIVGALPLAAGTLAIDGAPLARLDAKGRARKVALVGREVSDVSLRVRELVELGRFPHLASLAAFNEADAGRVDRAILDAGMVHLADRLVSTLSQGEAQRAHFARALAQAPALLLLDEATAHVDLAHREEMMGRLRRFAEGGGTVLAALHDLDLAARHCDGLVVLDRGELVAVGTPEEVLRPELLQSVFQVDAELIEDERGSVLRVYGASRTRDVGGRKTAR